jgi:hypothetical protein
MTKRTWVVFAGYVWSKTLLGLTFHPFTSVRKVVRRPLLLPALFTPAAGLLLLFVAGRLGSVLVDIYGLKRELIAFFLSTIFLSIVLWQLLLLYLLVSFVIALRK